MLMRFHTLIVVFMFLCFDVVHAQIIHLIPQSPAKPQTILSGSSVLISWPVVPNTTRYYLLPIRNGLPLPAEIAQSPYQYSLIGNKPILKNNTSHNPQTS